MLVPLKLSCQCLPNTYIIHKENTLRHNEVCKIHDQARDKKNIYITPCNHGNHAEHNEN